MTIEHETSYYQRKFAEGTAYERFIRDWLRSQGIDVNLVKGRRNQLLFGDTNIGVEIKFDQGIHRTGNVFIEVGEKAEDRGGDFVPSGIFREDACQWYGIGDCCEWYVCRKATLRPLWIAAKSWHVKIINEGTSIGFVLRKKKMYDLAIAEPCHPNNVPPYTSWDGQDPLLVLRGNP